MIDEREAAAAAAAQEERAREEAERERRVRERAAAREAATRGDVCLSRVWLLVRRRAVGTTHLCRHCPWRRYLP